MFTGGQPIDPGMPKVSTADKLKADFNMEIPDETVPLPSCGKTYPVGFSLCDKEVVEIRSMTAREEDILTNRALMKKGTMITELIRSCLVDKSVSPDVLLVGDRNALMVAIRVTGYGAEYDAELECTACETKSTKTFDLSSLPIRRLEIEPAIEHTNLFKFQLPRSKKMISFRFLTGNDEIEISATREKQKKLGMSEASSMVTTNLLYSIVAVDGVEDRAKIASFVKSMPAQDSLALRNYIKNNEPGIIMKQEVTCETCDHAEEVSVPLGAAFFWPGSQ